MAALLWLVPPSLLMAVLEGLLVFVVFVVVYYARASRRPKDFPPGPPGLPVLGNLHEFPPTMAFLKFHEWGKQYGDIMGLKLGPQNVVVLNNYKHVQELYDRRGGIYSSRPPFHIPNDIIYQNRTQILFLPYGDAWRVQRKAFQAVLNSRAVDQLLPIQEAEATVTVFQILNDANLTNWYNHIRRFPTAVILASVLGLRGASYDAPRVTKVYHTMTQVIRIIETGATPPVDIFPWLQSLPDFMSSWRTWAKDIRASHRSFWFSLVEEGKEYSKKPDSPPTFLQRIIEDADKSGLDEEHIVYIVGTIMEAGSDTTASTMLSLILALVKHPQVLSKAQQEIDTQCEGRIPTATDALNTLPYLRAILNELLRWRPTAPAGIPHLLTQDDYYQGYFIPKGTMLFANAWSIHRTEEFPEPDAFIPERWLESPFGTSEASGDQSQRRAQYTFGAGRRVCSGQKMAETSVLILMAKIIWGFDILPVDGHEIDDDPVTGYTGGVIISPKKFPVRFVPRSEEHARIMRDEYEGVQSFLSRFKD